MSANLTGRLADRRRQVLAAVVALAFVVLNVLLHNQLADDKQRNTAEAEALKIVPKATQELLSYDYKTIDKDLSRAVAWTTGSFTAELQALEDNVVKPTALSKSVATRTVVSHAAVVRSTGWTVEMLVFATQVTSSKGDQTQRSASRLSVTMKHVGGTWKVAALKPI